MMVETRGSVYRLLLWQSKNTSMFVAFAALAVVAHYVLDWTWLRIPTLPLAVVGGAIGIFVSFRTNSAYDRWWEGRKLWGRLINTSRHFNLQVMAYLPRSEDGAPSPLQRRLVSRHEAYVHALRCALRQQDPFADSDFKSTLPDDPESLRDQSSLTHSLLDLQLRELTQASDDGGLDSFRLSNFDLSVRHLLDIQGGCERIKKTPMPRGYGFIAERLVQTFALLFPLAVVEHLHVWTIPINLIVCLSFALISEAGRVLEDPFTMFFNGLPLSSISRMIQVNLEQRIGTPPESIPPLITVDERGILM